MFTVTLDQLKKFAPHVDGEALLPEIIAAQERFSLNTPRRLCYFLAQTYFETQGFTKFKESLDYSTPARLVTVYPTHFTLDENDKSKAYAPLYMHNSDKIANIVYASHYGNGDAASGDGAKYVGRGAIETTFKSNYLAASMFVYGDDRYVQKPEMLEQFSDAFNSAGYFWSSHNLNNLADLDSFTQVTKVINGSTVTVPDRLKVLNSANSVFVAA